MAKKAIEITPQQQSSARYRIGIDPGSVCTGIAIYDRQTKSIVYLNGFDAHCMAIMFLCEKIFGSVTEQPMFKKEDVLFRIEDARLSKMSFGNNAAAIAKGNARKQNVGNERAYI